MRNLLDPTLMQHPDPAAEYRRRVAESRATTFAAVERRGRWIAEHADLGGKLTVRLDRKTTLEGEIAAVRFLKVADRGGTAEALFEVDLICGSARTPRTLRLTRIPTRGTPPRRY